MLRLRPFCCLLDTNGQQTCRNPMEDGWCFLAYNQDQNPGYYIGCCVM